MCCSSDVVSTSTDIFCARLFCFFVFFPEKKLNLFIIFTHYIVQMFFLTVFCVGVISTLCCVSLHCFVGNRNSIGSVGSSRSTGSGQSSESTHNKQNESHLRTDMREVLVYAFNFEIIFQYWIGLKITFFL